MDRQKLIEIASGHLKLPKEELAKLLLQYHTSMAATDTEEDFWKKFSFFISRELPENWIQIWEEAKASSLHKVPGMQELLDNLKSQGFTLAILSNVRKEQTEFLKKLGYYKDFDLLVFSCETGVEKPDPKAYEILVQKLHLPKENCLFIDDEPENVNGARSFGMDSILYFSLDLLKIQLQKRGILC